MSEYEKLLALLTRILPKVKEKSISISRISTSMLRDFEKDAEKEVKKAGMPGRVISRRFDREGTANTRWAARKVEGDGHPILFISGNLKEEAVGAANSQFLLDNTGLNVFELSGKAQGLNNGSFPGAVAPRPFFAPFEENELEPIMNFAGNNIAKSVEGVI